MIIVQNIICFDQFNKYNNIFVILSLFLFIIIVELLLVIKKYLAEF